MGHFCKSTNNSNKCPRGFLIRKLHRFEDSLQSQLAPGRLHSHRSFSFLLSHSPVCKWSSMILGPSEKKATHFVMFSAGVGVGDGGHGGKG